MSRVEIQRRLLQPALFFSSPAAFERASGRARQGRPARVRLVLQGIQAISAVLIGAFILAPADRHRPAQRRRGRVSSAASTASRWLRGEGSCASMAATISAAYEQRTKFVQDSVGGIRDLILDHSQEASDRPFPNDRRAPYARARTRTAFLATAPRFLIEAAGPDRDRLAGDGDCPAQRAESSPALAVPRRAGARRPRLLPLMSQLYGAWASLSVARANPRRCGDRASPSAGRRGEGARTAAVRRRSSCDRSRSITPTALIRPCEDIDLTIPRARGSPSPAGPAAARARWPTC